MCDSTLIMKGIMTVERLAARIAETDLESLPGLAGEGQRGHAGQLSHGLARGLKRRARGWKYALQAKDHKRAMHIASRADALDDLLAEIASLVEVQRSLLVGLLREIAITNIDAIEGSSLEQTEVLNRLRPHRDRSCRLKSLL
jgi:hypothetical protein